MDLAEIVELLAVAFTGITVIMGLAAFFGGYLVSYVIFRIFKRKLSFGSYTKLFVSAVIDVLDFFFAIPAVDIPWDAFLGIIGIALWGKGWKDWRGWLQMLEIIPWPGDSFAPLLTISGILHIMKYEARAP